MTHVQAGAEGTERQRWPVLVLLAWVLAGAVLALGLGAAFTWFILLSLPALCAGLLLGLYQGVDRRAWAALAGAAWVPLWVAWTDRGGPGDVCTRSAQETSCSTVGSPWPWLGVGLLMVGVGLGLAARRSLTRPSGPLDRTTGQKA